MDGHRAAIAEQQPQQHNWQKQLQVADSRVNAAVLYIVSWHTTHLPNWHTTNDQQVTSLALHSICLGEFNCGYDDDTDAHAHGDLPLEQVSSTLIRLVFPLEEAC